MLGGVIKLLAAGNPLAMQHTYTSASNPECIKATRMHFDSTAHQSCRLQNTPGSSQGQTATTEIVKTALQRRPGATKPEQPLLML
jgi:hypothetical protein